MVVRIVLVAADNRLNRAIWAADRAGRFEVARFRNFDRAWHRAAEHPGSVMIAQWTVAEVLDRLATTEIVRRTAPAKIPLFVYCPELPRRTVDEGEEIRFALLQYGATAVFSQMRKLPGFLDMIYRCGRRTVDDASPKKPEA